MKVLWFEVTPPARYSDSGWVVGGWQDSLERIVRKCEGIELAISFEAHAPIPEKTIDGVNYIPIYIPYTKEEKKESRRTWEVNARKLLPELKKVVEKVRPDIIHVFGTEWPFGLVAEVTDIPVVVHIQGAMAPYVNATFPPNYSLFDVFREIGWKHPMRIKKAWDNYKYDLSRRDVDGRVWKCVENYMGRTDWDLALSAVMHPGRRYFHVEEALRTDFIKGDLTWHPADGKLQLFSTGCSNFWKGPDMLIKTAHILKEMGVDFEWNVAGQMFENVKRIVEMKEGMRFEDNNIKFLGFIDSSAVSEHLSTATMYVHTAYVENSPNSICEAQCIGVPIVSTNVGGISTLVKHEEQGYLVPANDPWQMAYAIISLAQDKERQKMYSENSRAVALKRHNDENIRSQLLEVYNTLVNS